jgi:hypothetical protein
MERNLKTYVMEINKDFSVLMTVDGQFLRYDIPAGSFEIGDEVMLNNFQAETLSSGTVEIQKKNFRIFKAFAFGFAAVVIFSFAGYFGVKYINKLEFTAPAGVASANMELLSDSSGEEKSLGMQGPEESGEAENAQQADESDEDSTTTIGDSSISDSSIAAPVLYEGAYAMDKFNTDLLVEYSDIQIIYRVNQQESAYSDSEMEKNRELLLKFLALKEKQLFNGNIDTILNDTNIQTTRTFTLVFENFKPGEEKTESIILEDVEKSFKIIIYGNFSAQ